MGIYLLAYLLLKQTKSTSLAVPKTLCPIGFYSISVWFSSTCPNICSFFKILFSSNFQRSFSGSVFRLFFAFCVSSVNTQPASPILSFFSYSSISFRGFVFFSFLRVNKTKVHPSKRKGALLLLWWPVGESNSRLRRERPPSWPLDQRATSDSFIIITRLSLFVYGFS